LAERAGLHDLAATHVRVPGPAGSNPAVKVTALVAGMVAGADSIDDMDLLRHAGMGRVFTVCRAPSTLGTFLRSFTFGHVRQLDAVASRVLVNLAERPPLLAGADQVAYLDIDDTIKATYGYAKAGRRVRVLQGQGFERAARDLLDPPVGAGDRRDQAATGQITVRSDSAYYNHDVIAAARTGGARFSITARMDPAVTRAFTQIPDDAWVGIKYPPRSTTRTSTGGCPTPRSPRSPSPRSPPAAATSTSTPG